MEENQKQQVPTSIKCEVPLNVICLRRTAEWFNNMANDFVELSKPKVAPLPDEVEKALAEARAKIATMEAGKATMPGKLTAEAEAEERKAMGAPAVAPPLDGKEQVAPPPDATPAVAPPPDGPELDGEGLPWDVRIHSGAKSKYAKPPHGWKLKRGVDSDLVASVQAELRQAMAATGAPIDPPATAAAPVTAPAPITSFPTLISRVAKSDPKLSKEELDAFAQAVGLQKWEQIANRTDLIPQIAEHLFPS